MNPCPKTKTFRSPAILELAGEIDYCTNCYAPASCVACHSNSIRHGKGKGIKAHDLPAYLCKRCHDYLDGRNGDLNRQDKEWLFANAMYETFRWLLETGHLEVRKIPSKRGAA